MGQTPLYPHDAFIYDGGAAPASIQPDLPIVDLGYELHQAFSLDETTQTYNFSNIRYAAPPTGSLRFRPPVPPEQNRTVVQNGAQGRVCPQGALVWEEEIMPGFVEGVLNGSISTGSDASVPSSAVGDYPVVGPAGDARVTEDCLFLDVVVPRSVFERARKEDENDGNGESLASVLIWIDGGGYISGDKTEQDPSGLMQRSMVDSEEDGIVYVAINYRLGAFGWLSDGNGTANAGLQDQRLALEWVKKYIGLFGGNPDRITLMGESAGAGSIVHQLAAYGGNSADSDGKDLPFRQAIIQSPMWYPLSVTQQTSALDGYLKLLNASSIDDARSLPSDQLIAANAYQIATTPVYGTFTYGPVIDGSFVGDLPSKILLDPNFEWQDLRLMTGHTSNEGLTFTPPTGVSSSAYSTILHDFIPDITPGTAEDIAQKFYPPSSNASAADLGYDDALGRLALTISDAFFRCKNLYLSTAFDTTYRYIFNVPPGLHSEDLYFTFYDPVQPDPRIVDVDVALAIQDYIVSFVQAGQPSSSNAIATAWKPYRLQSGVLKFQPSDISSVPDPVDIDRCHMWWKVTG
ncbi:carboxylesterase family protein [Aspergillus homomorphus CBS 101889]|uniref:Carboxylic ester hydrolase n=1 Tax=Aspergillus homomorphus (strain CBS 101889) TaxID=1450537 RepID=A0A395HXL8_ASPHC|nr:carboxylesterase family protein [Aspergillus homomorphus CBS 101889]RAL12530.1 carboxylesterase family protein [Aspergillus homomorphus CBS 101889]